MGRDIRAVQRDVVKNEQSFQEAIQQANDALRQISEVVKQNKATTDQELNRLEKGPSQIQENMDTARRALQKQIEYHRIG
uniref:Uncharacterized protein n=1 Tax=Acrobeloides nanus TaxID=290746 RepID=A0A914CSJ9_9BILA